MLLAFAVCSVQHVAPADWAPDIAVAAARQLESESVSSAREFPDSAVPVLRSPVARSGAAEAPFAAAELEAVAADWAPDIAVAAALRLEAETEPALRFPAERSVAAQVPFAAVQPEAFAAEHSVVARNFAEAGKVADLEVVDNCAAVPAPCALGSDFAWVHLNAF